MQTRSGVEKCLRDEKAALGTRQSLMGPVAHTSLSVSLTHTHFCFSQCPLRSSSCHRPLLSRGSQPKGHCLSPLEESSRQVTVELANPHPNHQLPAWRTAKLAVPEKGPWGGASKLWRGDWHGRHSRTQGPFTCHACWLIFTHPRTNLRQGMSMDSQMAFP